MKTRKSIAKSLADVAAFVQDCNTVRLGNSAPPFEASPEEIGPATFPPISSDVLAEAKAEGRLITLRRINPHD